MSFEQWQCKKHGGWNFYFKNKWNQSKSSFPCEVLSQRPKWFGFDSKIKKTGIAR